MVIIVMGVTGSGKTTVGKLLAERLHWAFYDADDFHTPENITKMRDGIPLTDADRWPWLDRLREVSGKALAAGENAVIACSALRKEYRERLMPDDTADVRFVYLQISREIARTRLENRRGHYMPASLVDSQFDALEEPTGAEPETTLDGTQPPETSVQTLLRGLKLVP